jgi:L,D-transpeptidase catalytic domain
MANRVGIRSAAVTAVVMALLLPALPARGQEGPGVTLEAARSSIDFGETVRLSGEISPPSEGETITIVDDTGAEMGSTTTNAQGRYTLGIVPRKTKELRAMWLAAISEPVQVKVHPRVVVRLENVRLFGRASVSGNVRPVPDGGRVTLSFFTDGRRVGRKEARVRNGRFRTRFEVARPSTLVVRAFFIDDTGTRGDAPPDGVSPPLPGLGIGSRGPFVELLERKLLDLAYHLNGADSSYTVRTADAVRAFNKVERRARLGTVDAATWRAMAAARVARPRYKTRSFHIEVDQTRQVLLMVDGSRVTGVLHVSTGAGSATRDGTFHVFRKVAGYSVGRLYYPSYWDGLRAFHGWPEVPTYNASHGCVRLPMWSAKWVYKKAKMGVTVRIYH